MVLTLKTLHEKGSLSCDCILMIDEIYLRISAQCQSGEYVGVDEEGIITFMVVGLKVYTFRCPSHSGIHI